MLPRRSFLRAVAATGTFAGLGSPGLFKHLPSLTAAEVAAPPQGVRLDSGIEPLVRVIEEMPRDRVLEEAASRIRRGLSYQEVLAALMLAGVRNIQPRPVGFKFHAVLVVNSAHLASVASPDADRWLPIFWAIDQFKASQAADIREGDWTLGPAQEAALPPPRRARQAFIEAMDAWDEAAADAAATALARSASVNELFELFARYGVRDFRDIGHKAIYVANSFRTLEVIGWHHAEPVLRSLAYALLDGASENPAQADLPADRPFRSNAGRIAQFREHWRHGSYADSAVQEILATVQRGGPEESSELALRQINDGIDPGSIFAGLFASAGELLMQAPGILALHAMTFTNAVHYAWLRTRDDETRRLLLLQNAAFLPLFRAARREETRSFGAMEPLAPDTAGGEGAEEIFAEISRDRWLAARKMLGWLDAHPDPAPIARAARRLVFLKGTNSHDYKYSSAVLEDCAALPPRIRNQVLAASAFYFRGSGDADNGLVHRIRSALGG
jgi:hypothetical protein